MTRLLPAIALSFLLLAPTAEAGKRRPPPDVVDDALAFASTDRAKAIAVLEGALEESATRDRDVIEVHLAEQLRLAGRFEDSRRLFLALSERTSKGVDHEAAVLGLTLVDARGRTGPRVMEVLRESNDKEVLTTQNADRYLVLAADAARKNDAPKTSIYSKKALAFAGGSEDPEVLARVTSALEGLVGAPPDKAGEILGGESGPDMTLVRAEEAWAAGDLDKAKNLANRAMKNPETSASAAGLLKAMEGTAPKAGHIVVLIPLSGKFGAVGKRVKEALELGYDTTTGSLNVVDSGESAESWVAACEKAVLQDGAIAVVGPILTDQTPAAVETAESLHVPLISLSQALETANETDWTYQAMYTRADQIRVLVDYAMNHRDMNSFAVFHPDNDYGNNASATFSETVKARGGTITDTAKYSSTENNLMKYAHELGERSGNLAELQRRAAEFGRSTNTVVLPPVVDFDGIFLPDSVTRTPLAAAALAYDEFPMGTFQPNGEKEVPLLGLSAWNNKTLVATGNEYTRNSIFTDVFSTAAETDLSFAEMYEAKLGRRPTALEAVAVDAGRLLAAAAKLDKTTRSGFREALLSIERSDTVTGARKFDETTHATTRKMHILTITREGIERLETLDVPAE